jgi:DNA-binding Lrp family transcriptional regulator
MYGMSRFPSNSVRDTSPSASFDRIDFAILDALQKNARLSNKELAAKIGLAPSSCFARVRKLTDAKVLQGFHAEVNPVVLGVGLQAIIAVRLARHSRDKFRSLYEHIHHLVEILQVFHVSGVNDLLLHVAVRDVAHLRDLVVDQLATRSEVANCETSVIFSLFRNARLPVYIRG